MGIVNRTMDVSEQKYAVEETIQTSGTGVAYPLYTMPQVGTLVTAKSAAYGVSGTPTATLGINRFIPGAGQTTIAVGGALTQVNFGTSGIQTFSLPAVGASQLVLQAGDVLVATTGGANSGTLNMQISLVIQATQDIKTWF